ncbi:MAG: MarR family transcriptional regulator [Gammaproteobacteria bacterium]|nr:MarR family transcriptional regulator [Gammaproteobacteria bacterium]
MNQTTEQFGSKLIGLARQWRAEVDRRLKPLGMTEARWLALHHLAASGGSLNQSELAERLGIRGPTLVSQLDLLESHGWVERSSAPNDRRSKLVRVTESARPLTERIESVIREVRSELFVDIDEKEIANCLRLIQQLEQRVTALRQRRTAT